MNTLTSNLHPTSNVYNITWVPHKVKQFMKNPLTPLHVEACKVGVT
jgi:hypothetical protein